MSAAGKPVTSEAGAVLQGLWVEPEQPTLAGLAQLLAGAEACGFLAEALWFVDKAEYGKLFLDFLRAFEEVGSTWAEVALGLEQAAQLLSAASESEQEVVLAVGLPVPQLAAALRVRQALSTGREHAKAGELAAQLASLAESEASSAATVDGRRV